MNRTRNYIFGACLGLFAISAAHAEHRLTNPNLAGKDELMKLHSVDEGVASAIVEGRPFLSATDLDTALAG